MKNAIYHGSPGWTDVPRKAEVGFVDYIRSRSSDYGWYTAAVGWIMLPPDTAIPKSTINDLTRLQNIKNIPEAIKP